ncbi:50S ribosomal protein L25 [Dehalobacterium formicoaceticum]|uniref:50S ribosomal protein L25 n=1 Tax=Dehalobacterium formicoaceticum TaxID=51515 RepID=UPI000B7F6713|nr:50S ribosomal protein L25 [Dehalobacterium formicoaceticum]
MEKIILQAESRTGKPKATRAKGLVPGILYGKGEEAIPVSFQDPPLRKVLTKYGHNAKIWVDLNNQQKFGFIKDVQKHPVEDKILHIDVQMVSQDQEVKMLLPITFIGVEELEKRFFVVQPMKPEVEVIGKMNILPNQIVIDVSEKELGDTITYGDFGLDEEIKNNDPEDEVYGIIKAKKENVMEEEESQETEEGGAAGE